MPALKFKRVAEGEVTETTGVHQFVQGKYVAEAKDAERHYIVLVDDNGVENVFNKGLGYKFDLVGGAVYTMRSYYGLRRGAKGEPDSMGTCYQQMLGLHDESEFIAVEYKAAAL